MATKLIREVNENTWRKFAGYCKIKNKKVGELLSEILENYLKEKVK